MVGVKDGLPMREKEARDIPFRRVMGYGTPLNAESVMNLASCSKRASQAGSNT